MGSEDVPQEVSAGSSASLEVLEIPVEGLAVESVGAILQLPGTESELPAILFAHGAGAPMDSDFMDSIAGGLVQRGFPVLRFRYAYMERAAREERRFPPDRAPKLEAVHRAALETLRQRLPGRAIFLAGKSMGARIASHLAAQGELCAGLIYLGYPLHPAKKPEKLRVEHFPRVHQRTLFLQGTRDALCVLDLLERELVAYAAPHELVIVEGGDHSFAVLKRSGRTADEVQTQLLDTIERFILA